MTDLERRAEEYADEQIGCGDGYYEWTDVKQAYIAGATETTKELQEENKQLKKLVEDSRKDGISPINALIIKNLDS